MIELIFFVIRVGLSIWVGAFCWRWGPASGVAAAIVGFLAFPWVVSSLSFLTPPRDVPPCTCGKNEHTWIGSHDHRPVYRCRCGLEYVLSEADEVKTRKTDGSLVAYMKWTRRRGWTPSS